MLGSRSFVANYKPNILRLLGGRYVQGRYS